MIIDVEKIITKIQEADEIEIMEFDFDECFTALREMKYELEKTNKQLSQYKDVVEAAKKHLSFNKELYLYDKENENLGDRSPETVALLEALSKISEASDE